MRRGHPAPALDLSSNERRRLSLISRSEKTASTRALSADERDIVAVRARIIRVADEVADLEEVAVRVGVSLPTVRKWCARFLEHRIDGLVETRRQRGGRELSEIDVSAILSEAERVPAPSTWQISATVDVSQSSVSRTLRARTSDAHARERVLPSETGAYILEFALGEPLTITAGRLGRVTLPAGRLRYYGSANGPGGLRARIERHLRRARRVHWHVDALTRRVPVAGIETVIGGSECELAQRDLAAGWVVVVPGFGSSDCPRCPAHLLSSA